MSALQRFKSKLWRCGFPCVLQLNQNSDIESTSALNWIVLSKTTTETLHSLYLHFSYTHFHEKWCTKHKEGLPPLLP